MVSIACETNVVFRRVVIGNSSNDDGDGIENGKKSIAFLYIPLPSLHDYDVKLPNFTFCGGREHKITIFVLFFLNFDESFEMKLHKNTPTFFEST